MLYEKIRAGVTLAVMLSLTACVKPDPQALAPAELASLRAEAQASSRNLEVAPLLDGQRRVLLQQVERAEENGDFESASQWLERAAQAFPDDPMILQRQAEMHAVQGQWDQAVNLATRVVSVGPEVGALCWRARALLQRAPRADVAASAPQDCVVPAVKRL